MRHLRSPSIGMAQCGSRCPAASGMCASVIQSWTGTSPTAQAPRAAGRYQTGQHLCNPLARPRTAAAVQQPQASVPQLDNSITKLRRLRLRSGIRQVSTCIVHPLVGSSSAAAVQRSPTKAWLIQVLLRTPGKLLQAAKPSTRENCRMPCVNSPVLMACTLTAKARCRFALLADCCVHERRQQKQVLHAPRIGCGVLIVATPRLLARGCTAGKLLHVCIELLHSIRCDTLRLGAA